MTGERKGLEEVTEILSRRGWRLYREGQAKGTGTHTTYEKAVESLEANAASPSLKPKECTEKPKATLKQIIRLQKHLDERFSAKKGSYLAASYTAKRAASTIAALLSGGRIDASIYRKTDTEIITNQRVLTKLLFEDLKQAKSEMGKSCGLLGEYRLETARDLNKQTRKYLRIEKALSRLEEDESILKQKMASTTAESSVYAELLHSSGNVRLERQKLVNDYENTAGAIKNSKTGIDELTDYQLVVQESEQILGDACNSLEQVATRQAIAQTVLSAFTKGEASMDAASHVMDTLSSNVATTYRIISGAFESMNRLSASVGREGEMAGSATEASRALYGSLRNLRREQSESAHKYARQLFEKPMAEPAGMSGNGHRPVEAAELL